MVIEEVSIAVEDGILVYVSSYDKKIRINIYDEDKEIYKHVLEIRRCSYCFTMENLMEDEDRCWECHDEYMKDEAAERKIDEGLERRMFGDAS